MKTTQLEKGRHDRSAERTPKYSEEEGKWISNNPEICGRAVWA